MYNNLIKTMLNNFLYTHKDTYFQNYRDKLVHYN